MKAINKPFNKNEKKNLAITFFLIYTNRKAQSDLDKDQQLVYIYLYSKEYDQAKDLLENKFIKNNDLSKQVIGYISMADYYNVKNDEVKKSEALEKSKNIARKTKSSIDKTKQKRFITSRTT